MGLISKSILILITAISTPLLYRQFATDNTVRLMSSYYSNYKVIDTYLRQSASYLDRSKDYLPSKDQLEIVYNKLNKQFQQFTNPNKSSDKKSDSKDPSPSGATLPSRMTNCPDDELQVPLWSKEELKRFDGSKPGTDVLLGFLGIAYNVTVNTKHYGPGADYNVFAGRDATRAFVTGNFTNDLNDDITDIDETMYTHFETWTLFYSSTYQSVGRIEGRFYDSKGCETAELKRVQKVYKKIAEAKEKLAESDRNLPECNTEWNSDTKKGRVWCSKKSGGVEREWVGVPRVLDDGITKRCVCMNLDGLDSEKHSENLTPYSGCDTKASECPMETR